MHLSQAQRKETLNTHDNTIQTNKKLHVKEENKVEYKTTYGMLHVDHDFLVCNQV